MARRTSETHGDCETPEETKSSDDERNIQRQGDDEELPFLKAYRVMFTVAACIGLHVATRDDTGRYRVSGWRLVPTLLIFLIVIAGLLLCQYIFLTEISYYQRIMLIPLISSCVFSFYGYSLWLWKRRDYLRYLTAVETNSLTVKKKTSLPFIIVGITGYSLVYTACLFLTAPLPEGFLYELLVPVFIISFLPSFLDLYMFSFVLALTAALAKLGSWMRGVEHWTLEEVSETAGRWLRLCHLLHAHNKIFRYALFLRLSLFMVQAMSFTFSLALVWPTGLCLPILLPSLVPLAELIIRFLCVCLAGESLLSTYDDVLAGMREAVCASSAKQKGKCVDSVRGIGGRRCLHDLLSRMESRPLGLQVWGMDKLCGRTFVTAMGVVVTYLLVLLQMQPQQEYGAVQDPHDTCLRRGDQPTSSVPSNN